MNITDKNLYINTTDHLIINTIVLFSTNVGVPKIQSNMHGNSEPHIQHYRREVSNLSENNTEQLPAFIQFVFNKKENTIIGAEVVSVNPLSAPQDLEAIDINAVVTVSEMGSPKILVSWAGEQPVGYGHHTANVKFTLGWNGESFVQLLNAGVISIEEGIKMKSNTKSNVVHSVMLHVDTADRDFEQWSVNKFDLLDRLRDAKFWLGNTDYAKARGVWAEAWSTLLSQQNPEAAGDGQAQSLNDIDNHFVTWSKGKFNGFGTLNKADFWQGSTDSDKARGVWAEAYKTLRNQSFLGLPNVKVDATENATESLSEQLHSLLLSNAALQAKNAQLADALTASDNLLRELPDINGFYGLAITEANATALEPIDETRALNDYSNALIEKCKQAIYDILDDPVLSGHGYANSCLEALDQLKSDAQSKSARPKP